MKKIIVITLLVLTTLSIFGVTAVQANIGKVSENLATLEACEGRSAGSVCFAQCVGNANCYLANPDAPYLCNKYTLYLYQNGQKVGGLIGGGCRSSASCYSTCW